MNALTCDNQHCTALHAYTHTYLSSAHSATCANPVTRQQWISSSVETDVLFLPIWQFVCTDRAQAYSTRSMMADAADHDLFHKTHKQRGPNVSSKCRHIMTPPLFAKSTVTPCSHGHPCSTKGRYRCAWRVRVTETSFRVSVSSRSR